MPIDALLFDKDGTLFDFAATWEAFARAFLLRVTGDDLARATEVGQAIGFDMATNSYSPDSIVIAGTPGEVAEVLTDFFPDMTLVELIDMINDEAARAPQAEAVPLGAFLDDMRAKGLKLGVATNDAERPARAHLSSAGVQDKFDFIAGFDSGHGAKPGPGQLLAFAAHVGVAPGCVAMVGDSTHDLLAGRAAGMTTIGVLTGMATADDLSPHADVVLPNIGHIAEWLAR
ncbi:Phosphoglycolate phosphatase [Falsiruegeria litorea R37]|uniref:phosphoglycolate phosphatase n=1 Tax=Falsiruegeria litorea R37 TaxID=1200284 RepID=A0A1Y5SV82_9RHOB|nr:HAD family hydrolase [Falsiruegeria litorea]SLN49081.1 Phosphoglycolate phosphatase [Falsiruegeria litorea R37]